jgi:hypothetical protein
VLVTCLFASKVKEFTTNGEIMREINLGSKVLHPWHTAQMSADRFIVCHGMRNDSQHRVCMVDSKGTVLQQHGESKGTGPGYLNVPLRVTVNKFIFVADCDNHRVLMLSPTLDFVREIGSEFGDPSRIWFDASRSLLYVAYNKQENDKWVAGQIKVFQVCR